jgi:hypothetical protein
MGVGAGCAIEAMEAEGVAIAGLLLFEQPLVPNVSVATRTAATSEPLMATIFAPLWCFFGGLLVEGVFPLAPLGKLALDLLLEFACKLSWVKCAILISCAGFTSRRR